MASEFDDINEIGAILDPARGTIEFPALLPPEARPGRVIVRLGTAAGAFVAQSGRVTVLMPGGGIGVTVDVSHMPARVRELPGGALANLTDETLERAQYLARRVAYLAVGA